MNIPAQPPIPSPQPPLHIAIDLGTTTLSGSVIDSAGSILATAHILNHQKEFGADILARLDAARNGQGRALQEILVKQLRDLVARLLEIAGCLQEDVVSAALAGNPGMSCLLLNAPVDALLAPPHKSPCKNLRKISSAEIDIGLYGRMELLPPVSGFVGGDLVACLLAITERNPGTLMIDLGTNAELGLWDGRRWLVASAAAGPAFEGGHISSGMLYSAGAVTDVRLTGDRLVLTIAGGGQALGLCGSGLTALVAAARQGGLIDASGRILSADEVDTNLRSYLVDKDGHGAICYYRDAKGALFLTQQDLRSLQLAKAAVHAGVRVLCEKTGLPVAGVQRVLLTGALGTSLGLDALKSVALLPEPMLDKTSFMANGVLAGLQSYLIGKDRQKRLDQVVATMQPFPLSGTPAFEKYFLDCLGF